MARRMQDRTMNYVVNDEEDDDDDDDDDDVGKENDDAGDGLEDITMVR